MKKNELKKMVREVLSEASGWNLSTAKQGEKLAVEMAKNIARIKSILWQFSKQKGAHAAIQSGHPSGKNANWEGIKEALKLANPLDDILKDIAEAMAIAVEDAR